jgi:hypothetical protein
LINGKKTFSLHLATASALSANCKEERRSLIMSQYKCLCGDTATMESIISIKSLLGKPVYAWRIVCKTCKAGMYDLKGSSTREKAEEKFNSDMKIADELAKEFGVSKKRFLNTVYNN